MNTAPGFTEEDTVMDDNSIPNSFGVGQYWRLRKAAYTKWRATSDTRVKWLLALLNRSRPPYVDNDLMGPR